MPSSPPLSVAEASDQKNVPGRTIRYAILNGELKAHKMPGETGAYLIRQRDLDKWAAKRAERAEQQTEASA
jgi:excisionase family DNA binding protein